MPFRFFTIPIHDAGQAESELNGFLRGHRVLAVDRRWVEQGVSSFWCFCVDYLDAVAAPAEKAPAGRGKVDYKDILKPDEFQVFARLRDLRKEIASAEAVPVYTIFTNEQLAQMVQARADSKAALEKIAGVGNGRVEKYGGRLLEVLVAAWKGNHEADRPPL